MPLLFGPYKAFTADASLCRHRQNTYSTRLPTFGIITRNLSLRLGPVNIGNWSISVSRSRAGVLSGYSNCPRSMAGRHIGESFGTIARKGVVTSWARLAPNAVILTKLPLTLLLTLPLILEEGRPCGM